MPIGYLRRVFFQGLIAVLPIVATVYLTIWLFASLESLIRPVLSWVLPESDYLPGMGITAAIIVVFGLGFALEAIFARRFWTIAERLVDRMPVVSHIYGAIKQVISYVGEAEASGAKTVVMVRSGNGKMRMLGLVTRENLAFIPQQTDEDLIAVFLPWSYQVGGFTVFVPRSAVEPAELTPQEALRFCLTAGIKKTSPLD
jgi:uncharacterized membrane protein